MSDNLSGKIKTRLPPHLVEFLKQAGEIAFKSGMDLYLVGGAVRDLFLDRINLDLDLVVDGDAVNLAKQLAELKQGKITVHPRFHTAKVKWSEWSIDLATSRTEIYTCPGALPTVRNGSIKEDLSRRDFTINAMAVYLEPESYGEVIDLYGGKEDLNNKKIRILHKKSFIDDATRILRAVRYEQRLGFQIESVTLSRLKKNIAYLNTISGDRIRHELELILKEKEPENIIGRVAGLGILTRIHPSFKYNSWLAGKFKETRNISITTWGLYLALMTYHFSLDEIHQLNAYLNLPKSILRTLQETIQLKSLLPVLFTDIPAKTIRQVLDNFSIPAITANLIASDSPVISEKIKLYLEKIRYVKSILSGDDLLKMGISAGPQIKELLQILLEARLTGTVKSRQDEESLVNSILRPEPS